MKEFLAPKEYSKIKKFVESVYDDEKFNALVESGFNVNLINEFESGALYYSYCSPFLSFLDLYPYIFTPEAIEKPDRNPMAMAAKLVPQDEGEYFKALSRIFKESKKHIQDKEQHWPESIFLTYLNGNYYRSSRVIKMLCELGADPNARDAYTQETPLHIMGISTRRHDVDYNYREDSKCIQTLLEYGADINALNSCGETPAHIFHSSPKAMKFLLENAKELDVDVRIGQYGITPLASAIFELNYMTMVFSRDKEAADRIEESIKILLEAGADVNIMTRYTNLSNPSGERVPECAPLINWAVLCSKETETIKRLLEYGADATRVDTNERTVLHMLSCKYANNEADPDSSVKLARLLAKYGADINAQDLNGQTALHYLAAQYNVKEPNPRIEKLIYAMLDLGADPDVLDLNRKKTWECAPNAPSRKKLEKLCDHSKIVKNEIEHDVDLFEREILL